MKIQKRNKKINLNKKKILGSQRFSDHKCSLMRKYVHIYFNVYNFTVSGIILDLRPLSYT